MLLCPCSVRLSFFSVSSANLTRRPMMNSKHVHSHSCRQKQLPTSLQSCCEALMNSHHWNYMNFCEFSWVKKFTILLFLAPLLLQWDTLKCVLNPRNNTPTISFTRGRAFKIISRKKNSRKINVGIYLIKHANETYMYVITKPLYTLYIIEKKSRKINSRKKNARKRNGGCMFYALFYLYSF